MSCEDLFIKGLKQKGYRFTPQREIVLEIMHHLGTPSTAEEIYDRVHSKSKSIDKSTVYRTLDLLQEFGLISIIDLGEKEHLYEHIGTHEPHLHLVCEACGKIMSVDEDFFLPFSQQLQDHYGFKTSILNLTIPGLCSDCQEKEHQVTVIDHTGHHH